MQDLSLCSYKFMVWNLHIRRFDINHVEYNSRCWKKIMCVITSLLFGIQLIVQARVFQCEFCNDLLELVIFLQ